MLNQFDAVNDQRECMKQIKLRPDEQEAFAMAALAYRYDPKEGPAPVTSSQLLSPRRVRTTTTTCGLPSTAFKKTRSRGLAWP